MRIYLAATEDLYRSRAERRVNLKLRHELVSFNGTRGRTVRGWQAGGPPKAYCVDSGAHFFISDWWKHGLRKSIQEVERFQTDLVEELATFPEKPAWVVEMDLQDVYGGPIVDRWRERIWLPVQERMGVPVCFVWHVATDTRAQWDALVADPNVRALGIGGRFARGDSDRGVPLAEAHSMCMAAYAAGKPVHGFAQVKREIMLRVPFASVDSTSWASGALYGQHTSFDARQGKLLRAEVGRSAQAKDSKRVQGLLAIRSGGKLRAEELRGSGEDSGSGTVQTLVQLYQETADAYEAYEDWITEWWRGHGVDWAARLGW